MVRFFIDDNCIVRSIMPSSIFSQTLCINGNFIILIMSLTGVSSFRLTVLYILDKALDYELESIRTDCSKDLN